MWEYDLNEEKAGGEPLVFQFLDRPNLGEMD
jgi:hypothetical protein